MRAFVAWLRRLFGLGEHSSEIPSPRESVVDACRAVARRLSEQRLAHAVVGGFGLAAHGVIRATEDVDFLIAADDEPGIHAAMLELGFDVVSRSENLSTYVLDHIRVDFIHARRPYSREMLRRAVRASVFGVALPVATAEDIVALKLQARRNDSSRVQDTADIALLVQYNYDELDVDYLRGFFRLFDCEAELDELLKRYGPSP